MELAIDGYSNIINNNFKEFCSMEETINNEITKDFFQVCKDEILKNILTQFGLSQAFDHFKDGGNVDTVYNAEKGIFTNKEVQIRYNQEYDRTNYDDEIPLKRKKMFQENENIYSYLTNEKLTKDGNTHLDHVVSAKEIHNIDEARLYMTDDDRGSMSQDDRNLKPLESNINQSKNSENMEDWLNKERSSGKTNKEHYNINEKEAILQNNKSRKFINGTIKNNKYMLVTEAGISQGINMGKKQVIGLFLYETIDAFFILSTSLINNLKTTKTINDKVEIFKNTINDSISIAISKFENIKNNIFKTFITGLSSGFLANLITFLINQFATTVESLVKVINDSIHALIRAFQILVTKPNNISFKTASKQAFKIVSTAIIASGGVILTENIINFLSTTPITQFSRPIGTAIGATITGFLTALILYMIDNFRTIIHNIGVQLGNTIKYAKITSQELEDSFKKTIDEIDELYTEILNSMYREYEEISNLRAMAYDFNSLSSSRFESSIEYAKVLNVSDDSIIKNDNDLEDFFFN